VFGVEPDRRHGPSPLSDSDIHETEGKNPLSSNPPAKLAIDIAAAVVSVIFLWQHSLMLGLLTHFIPPPIGSALVIRFGELES
jgi:hypothetical protein